MLKDVNFTHLLLIANIPMKYLVLRKNKHQKFVKIFPMQREDEGGLVLEHYSRSRIEANAQLSTWFLYNHKTVYPIIRLFDWFNNV